MIIITTIEVRDQHGGFVRAHKDKLTGQVAIYIFDARDGSEEAFLVDPSEPKILVWLNKIYQPYQVDMLLERS